MADKDGGQTRFDVLVVGAGNAALTAALAAHQQGVRVGVLEKASRELRGGNTRFSGGIFRSVYNSADDLVPVVKDNDDPSTVSFEPYRREDYLNDIRRTSGGLADPELTEVLIDRSYETLRWMADLGVPFEYSRAVGAVTVPGASTVKLAFGGAVRALHEGVGLSANLFRLVERAGIEILYETQALGLLTTADGRVTGVEVRGPEGTYTIEAGATILASGGFQASPEMRTAYLGPSWSLVKVRGTRFNTGEMIRAAQAIGADNLGHWSGCHATPIDADAPPYGDLRLTDKTNRLSFVFSVMVNLDGERFVDEGEDTNLYTYAKFGGEILKQRGSVAFQVFDQQTVPLLETRYNTGQPVVADTLPALVEAIVARYGHLNIRAERFLATLEGYNAAVQPGTFDPDRKDGKRTSGLRPEKTNWATGLSQPPFVAYACTGGITFTFGGIRVNRQAAVVDALNRPIAGLFSTGEMTGGFFYLNYPGGAGLMRGAVFGKLAGEAAAGWAREYSGRK